MSYTIGGCGKSSVFEMYKRLGVPECAYVWECVHVFVCACVCMCMCVYVYLYQLLCAWVHMSIHT